MEILKVIREIISRLSDEEKAVARDYLMVFSRRNKPGKSVQLFDILVGDEKRPPNEIAKPEELENLLYGKISSGSFSRLLYRVRDKLLETLTLDVNVERESVYDERSKVTIEVRKQLSQVQILRGRGLLVVGQTILEGIIEQTKKYELYEELLIALRLMIEYSKLENGDKQFSNILAEYQKYDLAKNAVLRAEVNHARVNAELDFRTGQNAKTEWLKKMIDEMVADYRKTSSANVGFYYFYILTQYYQLLKDYNGARKSLQDNLRLLDVNPSIFTKSRVGTVLINLADNDLYLREFKRAFKTATQSLLHVKPTSFNQSQAAEILFYSKFYDGDYTAAREILMTVMPDINKLDGTEYRQGKRLFLLACACFMLREFKYAHKLTSRAANPITDDKEGWNLGERLLQIMALVELGQLDDASSRISALKVFMDSLNKQIVGERFKVINVLLRKLSNSGFNFKTTHQKEKEQIAYLQKMEWQPKSPEMIIFDQWFLSKVFKQKFVQVIPPLSKLGRNKATSIPNESQ